MKLYTSYYYQVRNFPSNLVGLSTARWPPRYIKLGEPDKRNVICIDCPPFKPSNNLEGQCNGHCARPNPPQCEFLTNYLKQLKAIPFQGFINHLTELAESIKIKTQSEKDIDFAFLVYETPQNLCSERTAIQQYFKVNNYLILEWALAQW